MIFEILHNHPIDMGTTFTLVNYLFFQLPFDLVNIAILALFFQWLEVSYTLNHIIQLAERQHAKLGKSGEKLELPAEPARKVYESDTNLLTETDDGKPVRTAS
tara:strand:+ start:133 stop:441 length:309 start_codon:yes stop_codon:yes gene_type:complete